MEELVNLLVSNNMVEFISSHADAVDCLDRLGLGGGRLNKKNLSNVLVNEGMSVAHLDITSDPLAAHKNTQQAKPKGSLDTEGVVYQDALANLEKELLNPQTRAANNTEEFKAHLGLAPNATKEVVTDGGNKT